MGLPMPTDPEATSVPAVEIGQRSRERRKGLEELERELCAATRDREFCAAFGSRSRRINLQSFVRAAFWWLAMASWTITGLLAASDVLTE